MKEIIVNNIQTQVTVYAHQTGKRPKDVIRDIEKTLFRDRPKYFNRLMNNTSQPTLEEAASIAGYLKSTIDQLFVFDEKGTRREKVLS